MSIQLNQLEYAYANSPNRNIINIEKWSVTSGDKLFIYGPSGCGKSTLLNLLCGFLQPTSGSISLLGESINKMSNRQKTIFRARNIGYIFQQFNLINYLNAEENLLFASYISKGKQVKNIKKRITFLLEALDVNPEDWSRPVENLSIGQQQRIAIARAFINKPQILIADEPTSSLDETNSDNFMSLLMTLCDDFQATLLMVSHDTRLKSNFSLVQNFSDVNGQAKKH